MHIFYFILLSLSTLSSVFIQADPVENKGSLFHCRFPSRILRNSRDVWVYLPTGYLTNGIPYPLLLVFDGQAYVSDLIPTPDILDRMIHDREVPKVVAVFISSIDQPSRNRELPCHGPFVEFLTQELLPWVHRYYNVSSDPASTVLAGSSYGGLAAAYAAWKRPDLFGIVLSQSGAFWWKPQGSTQNEWLISQFKNSPQLPIRFYLDAGTEETDEGS